MSWRLSFTGRHSLIHSRALLSLWKTESSQSTEWGRSVIFWTRRSVLRFSGLSSIGLCQTSLPLVSLRLVGTFPNLYPGCVSCLPSSVTLGLLVLRRCCRKDSDKPEVESQHGHFPEVNLSHGFKVCHPQHSRGGNICQGGC